MISQFVSSSPVSGSVLTARSLEPASDSVSPPLSALPLLMLLEHMIQKNQCLFTNTQCKVCCALLISESQKLAHYQSKKHANKVKRYLAIHGMETLKGETKKLDSDQNSRSKDKNQCCPICNMTFSSPVVAQSHYLGKTHAKNLKLKQQSTKVEGHQKQWHHPWARFQCKGSPFRKTQPPWKTRGVSVQHPRLNQP
ncbi:zinc finger protein 346 [Lynx pardinus]|uniref:Zinc finger protein 346 n=1 Tax=Lynx pardinus TaxID=191816 RepID=A0A485N3R0_LYNPA|nr:zinc finger protein 346 [Lynx pardinus]